MKYGDSAIARRYSTARDYAEVNQAAVKAYTARWATWGTQPRCRGKTA